MTNVLLYDRKREKYICFRHAVRKSIRTNNADITIEIGEDEYGRSVNDIKDTSCYECKIMMLKQRIID